MDEYIVREEAKKALGLNFGKVMDAVYANRIVDSVPTADVAPVRHGRWEHHYHDSGSPIDDKWYCSECNMCNGHKRTWYCPDCGAKMDGDGNV